MALPPRPERPAVLLSALLLVSAVWPMQASADGGERLPQSARQWERMQAREREQARQRMHISQALANGELEQALRLARRAVASDRQNPDALTMLAAVQSRRGEDEAAGRSYRQALALAPRRGDLLNNYGAWLCTQGQPAEALVLLDRARQDPAAPLADVQVNAGICAQRSGQWARAEVDLRQALDSLPAHPGALQAMAQLQLERGNAMAARAFYQRRLAAAPADPSVLQLAVKVEEALGDKAAAEHHKLRLEQVRGTVRDADARLINGDH